MKKVLAAGVLALSMVSAAHSATVTNGNFETNFSGTTGYTSTAGFMYNNILGTTNGAGYTNTPDGGTSGFINSNGSAFLVAAQTGSISFALADLVVGQSYSVSFIDAATSLSGISANTIAVAYNGTNIGSFTPGSTSWTSATTSAFTAAGTTGTLTFTGASVAANGGTRGAGIDAVSIAAAGGTAAVPEPATWAMMIGGFGMVGGALRRRRVTLSLA